MFLSKMGVRSIFALLLCLLLSNITAMCVNGENKQAEESTNATSEVATEDEDFYIDENGTLTAYNGKEKNVVIPENVKAIAFGVFMEHDEIESVAFPECITYIDEYAFYGCDNLTEVMLPESLQRIGRLAFGGCKKLEIVYLGQNVYEMGEFVFWGCDNLYCISVSEDNRTYSAIDGVLYSKDKKKLLCCPEGYRGEVVVDDTTVTIDAYSFFNCHKLEKLTLGKNVMYIDEGVFYCCDGLSDIVFGPKIKKIRAAAFEKCSKLSKVIIPKTVTALGNSAFAECKGLTELKFLNAKTEIASDILSKRAKTVIFGYNNSTAQKYAKQNKLVFKKI